MRRYGQRSFWITRRIQWIWEVGDKWPEQNTVSVKAFGCEEATMEKKKRSRELQYKMNWKSEQRLGRPCQAVDFVLNAPAKYQGLKTWWLMIWYRFLNDFFVCCVENGLYGARIKNWGNSWREWLMSSCRCWGKVITKRWGLKFYSLKLSLSHTNWTELKTSNHIHWVQLFCTFSSWCCLILRKQIHKYVWVLKI